MKHTMILTLVFLLSGCYSGSPWMQSMMEAPPQRKGMPKEEYPPLYVQGWQDGCETGISSNTNSVQKFFYKYKQNANLVMNDIYYRGWKDSFDYCQRYTRMYYSRQFP